VAVHAQSLLQGLLLVVDMYPTSYRTVLAAVT